MARWDNYFPILQLGAMDDKEFETKLLQGIGTSVLRKSLTGFPFTRVNR